MSDYHVTPNLADLSERPKCCLQESDELPRDISSLFNASLYHFDASLLPNVIRFVREFNKIYVNKYFHLFEYPSVNISIYLNIFGE